MISCNNCGTDNLDGSEYCDECGMKLEVVALYSPPTRDGSEPSPYRPPAEEPVSPKTFEGVPPPPPSFTTSTSIPRQATPVREPQGGGRAETLVLSSRGRTEALKSDGSTAAKGTGARADAKLVLERGGRVGKEFLVTGGETNIGRWDADSGIFPDVDLDQDDPEAKVSRRHARILRQNGKYYIEDLGSTNGTFVNRGRRLLPGHRHALQSGDEIIVGKTFLKFHIVQ
jgi:hypothetical protein